MTSNSIPFQFQFCKEMDAYDLSTATTFNSLLTDIRNHLLRSKSTRAIYVAMGMAFFSKSTKEVQDICRLPTDDDFFTYIASHWPTFKSCLPHGSGFAWGWVDKGASDKKNEIKILSDLVSVLELSANNSTNSGLPLPLNKLITTTVVLHELSHAFTKYHFLDNVTPLGVGPTGSSGSSGQQFGESGWLVEERMMGGYLLAEWPDAQHLGDVFTIQYLLLTQGSQSWELDVNAATTSLASLLDHEFIPPVQQVTKEHLSTSTSIRGRVTNRMEKPELPPMKNYVGLGIRIPGPYTSHIGKDR